MRTQSRHSGYNRCATAAELHRTSPVFEPRNHILWFLRRSILYVVSFRPDTQPRAACHLLIMHYHYCDYETESKGNG